MGPNGDYVTFHTTEGNINAAAEGGCCSHTWVESIEGPKTGKVIAVEDTKLRSEDYDEDGDVIQFYSFKVTIEGKGYLDIEYRNSSNGYYGGSLHFSDKVTPCAE
jgi:hypothetical protein